MTGVVIVPRWGGDADSDWYPWIRNSLSDEAQIRVASLAPGPDAPEVGPSVSELRATIGDWNDVVLVGHSVGCQVVLRYLSQDANPSVRSAVIVAGWFDVDEPWPEILPWLEDTETLESPVPMTVLLSDNDPFTSDHQATAREWGARGAEVLLHPGAAHFNEPREPAVIAAVRDAISRPPPGSDPSR